MGSLNREKDIIQLLNFKLKNQQGDLSSGHYTKAIDLKIHLVLTGTYFKSLQIFQIFW